MPHQITIVLGETEVVGTLNDSATAAAVHEMLPITAAVNLWGEEIYFRIPLEMGEEDPRETVAVGDIAYWPQGQALCIFLGTTPISRGDEVRPISAVNAIGATDGAERLLSQVSQGDEITIRR